ncbi:MAG TPA: NYN domain-containing protein [Longimicrobium sp.]
MAAMPRTYVYVDGFNLYYGALKGTPYRWLDLGALCRVVLPRNDVQLIKYFTARVKPRPTKPDTAIDQQTYLRALGCLSSVKIYFGHYLSHVQRLPLATRGNGVLTVAGKVQFVAVLKEEEKGSDVNLAAHLLHDAHRGEFDVAVAITNDSDLATPIELVTRDLNLPVGVVNPHAERAGSRQSVQLRQVASFLRPLRSSALRRSQFPPVLADSNGTFHKPLLW